MVEAGIFDDEVKFIVSILVVLSNRHDCERTVPDINVTVQVGVEGIVTSAGIVFIRIVGEVPRPLAIVMEKVAWTLVFVISYVLRDETKFAAGIRAAEGYI